MITESSPPFGVLILKTRETTARISSSGSVAYTTP